MYFVRLLVLTSGKVHEAKGILGSEELGTQLREGQYHHDTNQTRFDDDVEADWIVSIGREICHGGDLSKHEVIQYCAELTTNDEAFDIVFVTSHEFMEHGGTRVVFDEGAAVPVLCADHCNHETFKVEEQDEEHDKDDVGSARR